MGLEVKLLYAYLIKFNHIGDNPHYDLRFFEKEQKEDNTIIRCRGMDRKQPLPKKPCCKNCGS